MNVLNVWTSQPRGQAEENQGQHQGPSSKISLGSSKLAREQILTNGRSALINPDQLRNIEKQQPTIQNIIKGSQPDNNTSIITPIHQTLLLRNRPPESAQGQGPANHSPEKFVTSVLTNSR
ncbi:hypothetical protein PV326_014206 [Microctonus aethiopoides]|nr:hypothetical protein PV326_014206 [Microctonus aethiopoides]